MYVVGVEYGAFIFESLSSGQPARAGDAVRFRALAHCIQGSGHACPTSYQAISLVNEVGDTEVKIA